MCPAPPAFRVEDLAFAGFAAKPFLKGFAFNFRACAFPEHPPWVYPQHAPALLGLRYKFVNFGAGNIRAHQFAEPKSTLETTQGQILSQAPTDATRFWWHLYGS